MYPSRSRCALAAAAALILATQLALAEEKPSNTDPVAKWFPTASAPAGTVRLTLTPAAAPIPALQYTLVPSPYEQIPGNAEPMLQTSANLMPSDPDTKALREKVDDWLKVPVDKLPRQDVDKLLNSMSGALHYTWLGARRDYCHWDIPWEEGFDAMLPYLGSLRQVTRGLALRARVNLADGKADAALRDLQALQGTARYIGGGPTLIHVLVGAAVTNVGASQLEQWAQTQGAPNLYWAYVKLPHPLVETWPGLRGESLGIISDFPEFKYIDRVSLRQDEIERILNRMVQIAPMFTINPPAEWKTRETLAAAIKKMLPVSREYLLAHGYTAEQLKKFAPEQIVLVHSVQRAHYWTDEEMKCFGLPYWQMRPMIAEVQERINKAQQDKSEGLFTRLLADLTRLGAITATTERRLDMLRIVEAVRMYAADHERALPETLEALAVPVPMDSTTGKPFKYEVQGGTARLSSTAEHTGVNNEVMAYELRIGK